MLVELKARFDEARNVGYAQRLEDAGCNVRRPPRPPCVPHASPMHPLCMSPPVIFMLRPPSCDVFVSVAPQSADQPACGVQVAYGIVGLKTHAKCMLVIRRERRAPAGLRSCAARLQHGAL